MEYIIISHQTSKSHYEAELEVKKEVNQKIKKGYEPIGGVSVATEKSGYTVYYTVAQAMIKRN